jgi:hypothetical protein
MCAQDASVELLAHPKHFFFGYKQINVAKARICSHGEDMLKQSSDNMVMPIFSGSICSLLQIS